MYVIIGLWVVWAVAGATLAVISGHADTLWILVAILGFIFFFGLRAQQRAPYKVTVSPAGLTTESILGTIEVRWDDVRVIQLLRSRWKPERIVQLDVLAAGAPTLTLMSRLNDFDELVAQLRAMRPDLIRQPSR